MTTKTEGLSDRAEILLIAIPTALLFAFVILVTCAGCERASTAEVTTVEPVLSPDRALEASVAHMTRKINQGLAKHDLVYFLEKPVARRIVKLYTDKGWSIEVHDHADSSTYLRFSWPEVR